MYIYVRIIKKFLLDKGVKMKRIKRIMFLVSLCIALLVNYSYANPYDPPSVIEKYEYDSSYYIAIAVCLGIVISISILVLKTIYKINKEENKEDYDCGETNENGDKL